jgi:DNA-binding NtrC family response regulator
VTQARVCSSLDGPQCAGVSIDFVARLTVRLVGAGHSLDALERAIVRHAMTLAKNNRSAAARLLGMERKAFVRRMERLERPEGGTEP